MTYYYKTAKGSTSKMAQEQDRLASFDAHKAQAIDYLNRLQDYLLGNRPLPAKQRAYEQALAGVKSRHTLMWKLHPERKGDLDKIERLLIATQADFFDSSRRRNQAKAILSVKAAFAKARQAYSEMEYDLDIGKPGGVRSKKGELPQTSAEYSEPIPCAGCGHTLPPSAIKRRSKRCITCYRKAKAVREMTAQGWTITVSDTKNRLESFTVRATRRKDAVHRALLALSNQVRACERKRAEEVLVKDKPAWQSADGRFIITTAKK